MRSERGTAEQTALARGSEQSGEGEREAGMTNYSSRRSVGDRLPRWICISPEPGRMGTSGDPSSQPRQKPPATDLCYKTEISSLMDFNSPDASLDKVLLREEVAQLQEEVHLLRQMKDMLSKDLEETQGGCSADVLSATELRVQLAQKEQELDRAKEALQAMKSDRKRLKAEKADLVNQMQQLYATLESREEQLRDFIRNYEQHRKESEDAVKALAKEKDLLEREKWDLRRQTKEATEHTGMLRSQLDLKENRIKELEAELAMMSNCVNQRMEYRVFERVADRDYSPRVMAAKQSLATLTKDACLSEPPGEPLWQLSEDECVCVCEDGCLYRYNNVCARASLTSMHTYVCESVCMRGQRPCEKPEARLASLKCTP